MARPKRFAEMTMARFPGGTFAEIDAVLLPDEDRAGFIRNAVESEITRRSQDFYSDLRRYLLVGEGELDFCMAAIRRAIQERKTALTGIGVEPAISASLTRKIRRVKQPARKATRPRRRK
ncbi:MAG: hypothetical protein ACREFP_13000 [Acetobacteraceae bacterium]